LTRRLILAPAALRDLERIRLWLLQPGSGETARKRLRAIRAAIGDLRQNPCAWPYGLHEGVRERPVAGHRVMYDVVPDTGDSGTAGDVRILRVFGPGQSRDSL